MIMLLICDSITMYIACVIVHYSMSIIIRPPRTAERGRQWSRGAGPRARPALDFSLGISRRPSCFRNVGGVFRSAGFRTWTSTVESGLSA